MTFHRKPSFAKRVLKGGLKLAKWGFVLLILGALGIYGYVRYDYASAASELEGLEAEARELGLPLEPEDMAPHPPIAEKDNAAPMYRLILASLEEGKGLFKADDARRLEYAYRPGAAFLADAMQVFPAVDGQLRLAVQASEKTSCDYGRDWSQGPNLMFPELARYKDMVKGLCARGIAKVRSGQFEDGVADLEAASRIGAHAGQERTLISGLVMVAIDAITIRAIESAASFSASDAGKLKRLRRAVTGMAPIPSYAFYLEGEVFFGYYTSLHLKRFFGKQAEQEYDWGLDVPMLRVLPPLIDPDLIGRAYAARSLGYWTDMFRIIRAGNFSAAEVGAQLDRLAHRFERSNRPSDVLNAILMPVFSQAGVAIEKAGANRQMATAMIDALLFRMEKGRYPKDLAEIGAKITDPFDGKPIRYRVTDKGFRIYSVGNNKLDDGGYFQWEKSKSASNLDQPMTVFPAWERYKPEDAPTARPVTPPPARGASDEYSNMSY